MKSRENELIITNICGQDITFQAELPLIVNKNVLEKGLLFKNVSVKFMWMLSIAIKPATYLPKKIIFLKNDIWLTLFYIKRGSVEVLANDADTKPVKILKAAFLERYPCSSIYRVVQA